MHKSNKLNAIGRRSLLAGAGLSLAAPAVHAQAGAGVALVIGNSKYQWEAQLPNVKRDVPDIAKRFQAMGLKTELVQDAGRQAMQAAIEKWGAASKGAGTAAFYFAGHGANWGRQTFLVPADADLSNPSVAESLTPTNAVATAAAGAASRLVILDACRNNPADGWRQVQAQRGAVVNENRTGGAAPPNTLVMFSTAPGRVALDGPAGQNSPFAAALMRQLDAPTVDLRALPGILRRDLLIATEGRQVLFDRSTLQDSVTMKGARLADAANKSSWAGDPSRIVDLPNAYAYARENKFPIPEGLIAHRPPGASRDARMIGSFKYVSKYKIGNTPALAIVMSIEEGSTAEIILAGISEIGPFWRFVTARLNGGQLEFVPRDNAGKQIWAWSDANSGSVSVFSESVGGQDNRPHSAKFTRLDG
jgi:hypothetical protein